MYDLARLVSGTPRLDRPVLVAVDGVDGSGKTTFAGRLAEAYGRVSRPVHIVHLDDYLNPRAVRYRLGRDSPEGYVTDTYNLAAFREHVLLPLGAGGNRTIIPRWFDLHRDAPVATEPVDVPDDAVVIIEGMFLHRDDLWQAWDVSVFLNVPFDVSVARMARRDGTSPDPDNPDNRRYVDGQRIYLSECSPADRATYVIEN